jgi:outer membrane protein
MMNKPIAITLIALMFGVTKANAQEANASSYSLQQAIDYAYKNSPNYLNAQSDVLMAKYKRKEVIGMALPQITGSVDMKNFIVVPTQVLPNFIAPASYAGTIDALRGAGMPVILDPAKLDQNNYDPIAAQFGTRYQTTAGLNASLLVFSADYLVGLKATKEMISLMNISVARSKTEVVSQVSQSILWSFG